MAVDNYTEEWSGHNSYYSAKFRCRYYTSYNAGSNTSTVYVNPQYNPNVYFGGTTYIYNGGVYGKGSALKTMGSFQASDNLTTSGSKDSWNSLGTWSFTVTHDNTGQASFTCGIKAEVSNNVGPTYTWEQRHISSFGSTASSTISFTESQTLNVSYNANMGSGAPFPTYFYGTTENIVLSASTPTRTGYTFLGWSASPTATTATYSSGQNIGTRSSSLVLYAVWTRTEYTLTINGDAHSIISVVRNGVELNSGDPIYYGDVLSLNISASTGYQIESRSPLEDTITVSGDLSVIVVTSPMATIHIRKNNEWVMYLFYIRKNSQWILHQANIRQNGQWKKYF